jgi:hypothetical protein
VEHRVKDDYERNRVLVDLTAQPEEIKAKVDGAIREQISHVRSEARAAEALSPAVAKVA